MNIKQVMIKLIKMANNMYLLTDLKIRYYAEMFILISYLEQASTTSCNSIRQAVDKRVSTFSSFISIEPV